MIRANASDTTITTNELKVVFPYESYLKIMRYAQICDAEITGFADVDYNPETNQFNVGEVYLLDQISAPAEVDMDADTIDAFNVQMIQNGATQLPRLWWHSHVNMGTFFSGTDLQAIEDLKNESFTIAVVVNKKYELKASLKIYKPIPIYKDDIKVMILPEPMPEDLVAEVEEKVKSRSYTYTHTPYTQQNEDMPKLGAGQQNFDFHQHSKISKKARKRLEKQKTKLESLRTHYLSCSLGLEKCKTCTLYWDEIMADDHDPKTCNLGYFECMQCQEVNVLDLSMTKGKGDIDDEMEAEIARALREEEGRNLDD